MNGLLKRVVLTAGAIVAGAFAAEAGRLSDVVYVPEDASVARKTACRLDFRWPETNGFSTVVWFHGGGLTKGRRRFIEISPAIAQVTADYRLLADGNGVTGVDCIEDAAAAVAWALENVAAHGGNPKRVYVSGMSAGGYLTMMVGMAPKYLARHGFKPTDLAGLIPVSGQATTHFNVRKFAGDADPQFLPKIDELAPLHWVSADLPPILSVCGEPPWEWKCRSEENRLLIASCTALGHPNASFVCAPYCDHGRTFVAAMPYIDMFVAGRMPANLVRPERRVK